MLDVVDVSKTYGSGEGATLAIERLRFRVEKSEFVAVVGPSGCGKTTLLQCMSGLMAPTSGSVTFRGAPVTEPPRGLAIVFQDYARSLFPWLTVEDNVSLPIRKGRSRAEVRRMTDEALDAVSLSTFRRHYPWQLSGGMQQRAAIARALAYQPDVLLLDEPFASVDAQTRFELEDLVLAVRRDFGITCLLVTHDVDEAVYMSERVVILTRSPSVVQEVLRVELPEPRDQVTTKAEPHFAELRGHVYRAITDAHAPAVRRARLAT